MKLSELIDRLEEIELEYDDIDVIFVCQPSWPVAISIGDLVVDTETEDNKPVVAILQGQHLGYAKDYWEGK